MSRSSAPIIRHVSRRELAQNRAVWLANGGVYALFAVVTGALILFVGGLPPLRMQVFGAALVLIAIVHLRTEPPAIGTAANHGVIAAAWAVTGVAFWVFQPGGGMALAGAMFIGPLAAVRLQGRRQIAGHIAGSNLLALAVGFAGGVDQATFLAIAVVFPATATLAYSCVVVLEAAEAQGDELERLVRRDPLTGVGNRRLLDERLEDEVRRHERTQRPLSIVSLDLNGFKRLNDELGHAAGDELLRDVATALQGITQARDTVVRQGGDEFCLILPETSKVQAARTVNAVRAALAQTRSVGRALTTGIGVASYPEDAIDAHVLLHVADERLRADKSGSRPTALPGAVPHPASPTTTPSPKQIPR